MRFALDEVIRVAPGISLPGVAGGLAVLIQDDSSISVTPTKVARSAATSARWKVKSERILDSRIVVLTRPLFRILL